MKILLYGDSPLATTGLGKLHKILLGHLHDKYDAILEYEPRLGKYTNKGDRRRIYRRANTKRFNHAKSIYDFGCFA